MASDALAFEADRNPHPVRKRYAMEVLAQAKVFVKSTPRLEERARALHAREIKPLDALHLASAEEIQAEYFCTCDDRLLKRARAVEDLQTSVLSPLELIAEVAR